MQPSAAGEARGGRLRVLVAGHDLKFFTGLLDHFRRLPELEARVDQWQTLGRFDPARCPQLVRCAIVESKRHDRAVPRRLRTAWMGPGRGGQQEGCRKSEGSQAPGVADPWPQWRPCPHPHGPPYVAEFPPSTRH